ncbi:DUF6069 family protein [Rhodococcus sp. B50]|uniref:DUF6069 family protein n=1 Tax=Rhodococcus sp. B50 TaxID=2682847 RepID=UPI001BD37D51|nr:DUF6069 family protein [Rhodococcus sp. B50]MBS9373510.1 hypothetical protein [Rhodococcus sp. B50]
MSVTETSSRSTLLPNSRRARAAVVVVVSVAAALVANLVLWGVGIVAGGSFEHTDAGEVVSAAPGGVVFMTVVPLTVGLAVAALLTLWWNGFVRIAQVVGALLPLATIQGTISADFDTPSTVALTLMHVVIAAVVVAALEMLRARD